MKFILQPWQLMLIILASWVNREQQQKIEYLEAQLAVLKEQFGNTRIQLTESARDVVDAYYERDEINVRLRRSQAHGPVEKKTNGKYSRLSALQTQVIAFALELHGSTRRAT